MKNTRNMKALFITNVIGFHKNFHIPHSVHLSELNYEVHWAANINCHVDVPFILHNIPFGRSPFCVDNFKAYFQLLKLFDTYYDIIYISTPIAGFLSRIALIGRNQGRIIYSAHGYSFYNGNNALKNFLFRTIEKSLSFFTDCIFTMNHEDFEATVKYNFHCKELYNVDGVGVDTKRFTRLAEEERRKLRNLYNYNEDDVLLIYPAELSVRKNQVLLFEIMEQLLKENHKIKLLLPGEGPMREQYNRIILSKSLEDNVFLLGYRSDVAQLLQISDLLIASSLNEGLPINIIEALASGVPVVATKARGHVDLIKEGFNGYIFDFSDLSKAIRNIKDLIENPNLYSKVSLNAIEFAQKFATEKVVIDFNKVWNL